MRVITNDHKEVRVGETVWYDSEHYSILCQNGRKEIFLVLASDLQALRKACFSHAVTLATHEGSSFEAIAAQKGAFNIGGGCSIQDVEARKGRAIHCYLFLDTILSIKGAKKTNEEI